MATIEEAAHKVYKAALKKKAFTAGELAERAGFPSGRAISASIGALLSEGSLRQIGIHSGNTRPTYVKA